VVFDNSWYGLTIGVLRYLLIYGVVVAVAVVAMAASKVEMALAAVMPQ
jgi:hypothetical protein